MLGSSAGRWCALSAVSLILVTAAARAEVFEIVVLPDTEDYADYYPDVYDAQTRWIADHVEQENIAFVAHVGDTVHDPFATPSQWNVATGAMYRLDGLVPYGVSPGNHDLEDPSGFVARFGPSHFAAYDWYGDASANKLNSYQVFSAGGYEFLHITLQKGPDSSTRTWARQVIQNNPGMPTIITTHDYLDIYGAQTTAGNSIWNDLVKDTPQVFMVLCGHNHGASRAISTNARGRMVVQMMSNYQEETTSGGETDTGYLRKILFDTDNGRISIQTYSPTYTAQPLLTGSDHQFSFDAAFLPQVSGTTTSPIFVTDAATCRTAGYRQDFETTPGGAGTSLPLGWTAWQIAGSAGTFTEAHPIAAGDIAGAAVADPALLTPSGPPTGTWGARLANAAAPTGRALATNPGGNAAAVIQLKVTNGTGEPASIIYLYYRLDLLWDSAGDDGSELPGYGLFWSTTGSPAAADWHALGADAAAGLHAWDIALPVPLAPGADLYLRWADDNALAAGESAPENVWSLDDVRIVMAQQPDPAVRGDADCEGDLDVLDYLAVKTHMGTSGGATWQQGDFDHDGDVDRDDLLLIKENLATLPDAPDALRAQAALPEPATLCLLAAGGLACLRRVRPTAPCTAPCGIGTAALR